MIEIIMVETPIHLKPGAMRDWSVWIFTGLDNLCDRSDRKVGFLVAATRQYTVLSDEVL